MVKTMFIATHADSSVRKSGLTTQSVGSETNFSNSDVAMVNSYPNVREIQNKTLGKFKLKAKYEKIRKKATVFISERKTSCHMDWLGEVLWTIKIENTARETEQLEKNERTSEFERFLKTNRSTKVYQIENRLKVGHPPITQRLDYSRKN